MAWACKLMDAGASIVHLQHVANVAASAVTGGWVALRVSSWLVLIPFNMGHWPVNCIQPLSFDTGIKRQVSWWFFPEMAP